MLVLLGLLASFQVAAEEDPATGEPGNAPLVSGSREPDWSSKRPGKGGAIDRMRWLGKEVPVREVVWLNGEAGSKEAFLALLKAENTPQIQGGVLLLPDESHHPDWPGAIRGLRLGLPDYGWKTLSLQLKGSGQRAPRSNRKLLSRSDPDFPWPQAPERRREKPQDRSETAPTADKPAGGTDTEVAAGEKNPAGATNAATAELEQAQVRPDPASGVSAAQGAVVENGGADLDVDVSPGDLERVDSGMARLAAEGLLNRALVAEGRSGELVLNWLQAAGIPQQGLAIVLVDSGVDEWMLSALREQGVDLQRLVVLDLYDASDETVAGLAKQRMNFARRNQLSRYQQRSLGGLGREVRADKSMLVAQVGAWLRRVAPGRDVRQ